MSTPNGRFFEKLFHGRFIYSQSFCPKSAEDTDLTWDMNKGFTSNKPKHYLLDYGDLEEHRRIDKFIVFFTLCLTEAIFSTVSTRRRFKRQTILVALSNLLKFLYNLNIFLLFRLIMLA